MSYDILRNVIVSGYVILYQMNKFFVNILFFHRWQNVFATEWNGFVGRIWPAGRSLETPALNYCTPDIQQLYTHVCHDKKTNIVLKAH